MKRVSDNVVECSTCHSRALLSDLLRGAVSIGVGAAGAGCALEPTGSAEHSGSAAHLRLVPRARSIDAIRRELLEAHRLHVAAIEMQEAAEKAARLAGHNTVEKMARIQQLRTELVRIIEQPAEVA